MEAKDKRYGFNRREFLLVLGGTALSLWIAACAPAAPSTQIQAPAAEPTDGGTLIVGQLGDVTGFDPHRLATGNFTMFNQLYNTLVRYDENLEVYPELAETWELSEDGLSLQLNLRQGVLYHSGREFTSDDVAFSLAYVQDPEHGANILPLSRQVAGVETPDPYTAVMRFDEPFPAVFDLLDLLFMIDQESVSEIQNRGVGTGPFALEEWRPGDRIIYVRNNDYWREPALLERVEVRIIPDAQTQTIQVETGAIDYAERMRIEDYLQLQGNPDLIIGTVAVGAAVFNVNMNTQRSPFDNLLVREAIDLAIDRERMVSTILGGAVGPACLPYPETSIAYVAELADCRFDLDAARAKLEEAGLGDGFTFSLLTSSQVAPEIAMMAEILQADLTSIGVTVNIEDMDQVTYNNRVRASEYDMVVHTYGRASKDPASLFGTAIVWQPENNPSGYRSEEFTALVNQAASTTDPEERRQLYGQITELVREAKFVLPVAPNLRPWASRLTVHDLAWSVDGMLMLERTWVEQ